jgi:hypothetical protein
MIKNDNITKNPSEAGKRGGATNKGKKKKLTKLKEAIGVDRTQLIIGKIEQNIEEFITHKDPKIRLDATKAFTDYYKPRKREHQGNLTGTIVLTTNAKVLNQSELSKDSGNNNDNDATDK